MNKLKRLAETIQNPMLFTSKEIFGFGFRRLYTNSIPGYVTQVVCHWNAFTSAGHFEIGPQI